MEWLSRSYWDEQYKLPKTGWDIGYASPPLCGYFDQLKDKNIRILVPGAGSGWEVEYLYREGFSNVFFLDFSVESLTKFKLRCPEFPEKQIIFGDFFHHDGTYDLIVEHTFMSSIEPNRRADYVDKMRDLLHPGGKLVGLLFNHEFDWNRPPFGGTEEQYRQLFEEKFSIKHLSLATNSIKPRRNRELFVLLQKSGGASENFF